MRGHNDGARVQTCAHAPPVRRRVCFHLIRALAPWEARRIIACVIYSERKHPIATTSLLMCAAVQMTGAHGKSCKICSFIHTLRPKPTHSYTDTHAFSQKHTHTHNHNDIQYFE